MMAASWDEEAERQKLGLPTAAQQAIRGLTPAQEPLYGQLVAARRAVRSRAARQRREAERKGTAIVEQLAQLGISSSYEWRAVPTVELHLDEAEKLMKRLLVVFYGEDPDAAERLIKNARPGGWGRHHE